MLQNVRPLFLQYIIVILIFPVITSASWYIMSPDSYVFEERLSADIVIAFIFCFYIYYMNAINEGKKVKLRVYILFLIFIILISNICRYTLTREDYNMGKASSVAAFTFVIMALLMNLISSVKKGKAK